MDNKHYNWLLWCSQLEKIGYQGLPMVLEFSDKKQCFNLNTCGKDTTKGFEPIGFAPSSLVTSFAEVMMREMMKTGYRYSTMVMEEYFHMLIYQPIKMIKQL